MTENTECTLNESCYIEIVLDGIIDEDLYIRPLTFFYEGQSDYFYESMNSLKWIPAKYMLGGVWKGRRISEFEKFRHTERSGGYADRPQQYEYARGNIPKSHIATKSREPWYGLETCLQCQTEVEE